MDRGTKASKSLRRGVPRISLCFHQQILIGFFGCGQFSGPITGDGRLGLLLASLQYYFL
ncbi:hypothetical protein CPB86DRAFT_150036 [Serendipita vermifera]|nr:hypothetical protein CPB86DRAFT_150036 [Serendipita vermifera]